MPGLHTQGRRRHPSAPRTLDRLVRGSLAVDMASLQGETREFWCSSGPRRSLRFQPGQGLQLAGHAVSILGLPVPFCACPHCRLVVRPPDATGRLR